MAIEIWTYWFILHVVMYTFNIALINSVTTILHQCQVTEATILVLHDS